MAVRSWEGQLIANRYQVTRHIDYTVYQAHDLQAGCDVALKHGGAASTHEAAMLRILSHPQIPRLRDFLHAEGTPWLVLDLVDARSLEQMTLQQGPLALSQWAAVALQVCEILSYLHTLQPPIVRNDLHSGNVLVTGDGTVYLCDWEYAWQGDPGAPDALCAPDDDISSLTEMLLPLIPSVPLEMQDFVARRLQERPGARPDLIDLMRVLQHVLRTASF